MLFSSRIVTVRCSRVEIMRLPETSSISSTSSYCCCAVSAGAWSSAGRNGFARLVISLQRRHRNQLLFRISQRGQLAAEHATSIDTDRAVQPFGFGHGRVSVNHDRFARDIRRPSCTDRQTKLVSLARSFTVQGEVSHLSPNRGLVTLLSNRRERPPAGHRPTRND